MADMGHEVSAGSSSDVALEQGMGIPCENHVCAGRPVAASRGLPPVVRLNFIQQALIVSLYS